jgi:hypothetical protein
MCTMHSANMMKAICYSIATTTISKCGVESVILTPQSSLLPLKLMGCNGTLSRRPQNVIDRTIPVGISDLGLCLRYKTYKILDSASSTLPFWWFSKSTSFYETSRPS